MSLKRSRFTVDVAIQDLDNPQVALFHTMTGALCLLPLYVWQLFKALPSYDAPAQRSHQDGVHMNNLDLQSLVTLNQQGFLVPYETDESDVYIHWLNRHNSGHRIMMSKVLVTRRCNCRCDYCILAPETGHMSSETALAIDSFYLDRIQQAAPARVMDDYLGGEPLLNLKVLLEIASRRFFYCRGRGIPYEFSMTTNGTLLRADIVEQLMAFGLSGIRVSMAGPAFLHDRLRPLANRRPSYERILNNLTALSGRIPLRIECQYDSSDPDAERVPEMMDDMAKRGIEINEIAFTPILARRNDNRYSAGLGNPDLFLYLKQAATERGYPGQDEPPCNSCMADLQSVMVFDTDGAIIPCPSLQQSEMAYGHVSSGVDFLAEARLRARKLPNRCLEVCELLPLCKGGCRLQALINQGDFNGEDCHYNVYNQLLRAYIREKALQTLCGAERPLVHAA